MTIKEFAQLCACNTQTLRYYDRIDLLKPMKVDSRSGYRYYEARQAVDFVKIKNLQAADFTIGEIKKLLTQSDQLVYEAFEAKIAEQSRKLERIREIQQSYLIEKQTMEKIVYSLTDYILSQCQHPELLTEFGLETADTPAILALLRDYVNEMNLKDFPQGQASLTINDEVIRGEEAILERIHSLTKENLQDTILLNTEHGSSMEHTAGPEPDFEDYTVIFERQGWAHVSEFFEDIPQLQEGKTYCLWIRTSNGDFSDDLSFAMFLMGAVLYRQNLKDVTVNCSASTSKDQVNHFKLLLHT